MPEIFNLAVNKGVRLQVESITMVGLLFRFLLEGVVAQVLSLYNDLTYVIEEY